MSRRMMSALAGEPVDYRPIWLMRQAGRCLPEYRAIRKEFTFEQLLERPDIAATVTLQPIERFDFDAAILFADLMSPVSALGIPVRFAPGPVIDEPIRTRAQIEALPTVEGEAIAPTVNDTVRRVRAGLSPDKALIGFAGAPLSIAAYMVEGSGKKGFPSLRGLAYSDEQAFHKLMALLSRLSASYLIEQARAGADVIQVFDSWGGLFAVREWRRFVRPHLHDLLSELSRAEVPRILFMHGASHLIEEIAQLPIDALGVDWRTDLGQLRQQVGPERVLQGNLDPAVLLGGAEATTRAVSELLAAVPKHKHIMNLGHGIHPTTPLESIQALVDTVRSEPQGDIPS
jgi:uroporphyrinogen decarboxylase